MIPEDWNLDEEAESDGLHITFEKEPLLAGNRRIADTHPYHPDAGLPIPKDWDKRVILTQL